LKQILFFFYAVQFLWQELIWNQQTNKQETHTQCGNNYFKSYLLFSEQ